MFPQNIYSSRTATIYTATAAAAVRGAGTGDGVPVFRVRFGCLGLSLIRRLSLIRTVVHIVGECVCVCVCMEIL